MLILIFFVSSARWWLEHCLSFLSFNSFAASLFFWTKFIQQAPWKSSNKKSYRQMNWSQKSYRKKFLIVNDQAQTILFKKVEQHYFIRTHSLQLLSTRTGLLGLLQIRSFVVAPSTSTRILPIRVEADKVVATLCHQVFRSHSFLSFEKIPLSYVPRKSWSNLTSVLGVMRMGRR